MGLASRYNERQRENGRSYYALIDGLVIGCNLLFYTFGAMKKKEKMQGLPHH